MAAQISSDIIAHAHWGQVSIIV